MLLYVRVANDIHASWTRPHPLPSGDALALFIHSFLGLGTMCFDMVIRLRGCDWSLKERRTTQVMEGPAYSGSEIPSSCGILITYGGWDQSGPGCPQLMKSNEV